MTGGSGGGLAEEDLVALRRELVEEAAGHLEAVEHGVASAADPEAVAASLRALHTLKGSAGSIGCAALAAEAHALEDRLLRLRDAGRVDDPDRAELDDGLARLRLEVARLGAPPERRVAERRSVDRRRGSRGQVRVELGCLDGLQAASAALVADRARLAGHLREADDGLREAERAAAARGSEPDPALREALGHLRRSLHALGADGAALARTSRSLEQGLRVARLVPVARLFRRLAEPLRAMALRAGREVALHVEGETVELDKAVVERLAEPLVHLLRNAVAHGIEPAEERARAGKARVGSVTLAAARQGSGVEISVSDDGRGIDLGGVRAALVRGGAPAGEVAALSDEGVLRALLVRHVSTCAAPGDLAGRGLGLDAVRAAIETLGGTVSCRTVAGAGARFSIRLPVALAVTSAVLFKVGGSVYAIPAAAVERVVQVAPSQVAYLERGEALLLDGESLPLVRLGALLGVAAPPGQSGRRFALLLRDGGLRFAVTCDKAIGPREIVVRPLGLLAPLGLYSGATVSGSGKVQLILDASRLGALAARGLRLGPRPAARGRRILVVDDSRAARESAAAHLRQRGYQVAVAADGWEAWEMLQDERFDLLITDLEMPRVDGWELSAKVRGHPDLRELRVLVVTAHVERAAPGADALLAKPLRRQPLLSTVRGMLGEGGEE